VAQEGTYVCVTTLKAKALIVPAFTLPFRGLLVRVTGNTRPFISERCNGVPLRLRQCLDLYKARHTTSNGIATRLIQCVDECPREDMLTPLVMDLKPQRCPSVGADEVFNDRCTHSGLSAMSGSKKAEDLTPYLKIQQRPDQIRVVPPTGKMLVQSRLHKLRLQHPAFAAPG